MDELNSVTIKKVIFKNPATIVLWSDGTKTVSKLRKDSNDIFSQEAGLSICILKKIIGVTPTKDLFKSYITD